MFLAAFVVAALVIWLHRMFFGVQNYEGKTVLKKRSGGSMKLGAQQGYISLGRKSEKASRKTQSKPAKAKPVKAKLGSRVASGGNKVPWGW